MLLAIASLGALTLVIGFMPQPLILFSQTAAAALLDPSAYLSAVLPANPILEARP
jgi:multicomponent Na+:H+ antiporter subunit D